MNTYKNYTLSGVLYNVSKNFHNKGIYFIKDIESYSFLTYDELLKKSRSIFQVMLDEGFKSKEPVILCLNKNKEIIPALWACFLGGIIPTILPVPIILNEDDLLFLRLRKVHKMLDHCKIIVSDDSFLKTEENCITIEKLLEKSKRNEENNCLPQINLEGSDLAYIQFSSGSAGEPKGVKLTNKNIISNLDAIRDALRINSSDTGGSWMPLYHDMGLIGFHLTALYSGVDLVLIDTYDFIRRPLIFFDVIEKFKVTITGCPNFSQILLLKNFERSLNRSWNLSSLKAILNGAEPISVKLMEKFTNSLLQYKLKPEAMMPVYGMAEASLAVTFSDMDSVPFIVSFDRKSFYENNEAVPADEKDINPMKIVSVGKALKNCEVRIVDENFIPVADNFIGQIQIKGDNVTTGYLKRDSSEFYKDGWFLTGDMGFIYDGELFVTGRYKDIIFENGRNFYASDLENIAQEVEGVKEGRVVFCGVSDENLGEEKVILFLAGHEMNKSIDIFLKINDVIRSVTGISISVCIPIKSSQIPKTSSGKIQRYKLIARYLNGDFNEIIAKMDELLRSQKLNIVQNKVLPQTTTEKILHNLWCQYLAKIPETLGIDDTFYEAGGNSLGAVEMLLVLEKNYQIHLEYSILSENHTIRKLADYIDKHPSVNVSSLSRRKRFGG